MSEDMNGSANAKRACGGCGEHVIPFGVDWPIWKDGKPLCIKCNVMTMPLDRNAMPPCPACGGVVGITHFKTVSCVDCPYDAGGNNDTEDEAIRAHLLHCQRLTAVVPVPMVVIPPGWKLVPIKVDDAMIDAYKAKYWAPPYSGNESEYCQEEWSILLDAAPEWRQQTTGKLDS